MLDTLQRLSIAVPFRPPRLASVKPENVQTFFEAMKRYGTCGRPLQSYVAKNTLQCVCDIVGFDFTPLVVIPHRTMRAFLEEVAAPDGAPALLTIIVESRHLSPTSNIQAGDHHY